MEKSFDFGRLLKNHERKHKSKPAQFTSIASGVYLNSNGKVTKRLESRQKSRKSCRLTIFDSIRNISNNCSPAKPEVSVALLKAERRRQQLCKWKEEKEKKKKETAAQKKKPFVTGIARVPNIPAPPAPVKPSTSGRVTRSQTARDAKKVQEKESQSQSFAPKNATFKPPLLRNHSKVPSLEPFKPPQLRNHLKVSLEPFKPSKGTKTFTFDSVPLNKQDAKETKQTRSKNQKKVESKTEPKNTRAKTVLTKTIFKANLKDFSSSSSSENDSIKPPIRNRRSQQLPQSPAYQSTTEESSDPSPQTDKPIKPTRKSLPCDSPILGSKTIRSSATPKLFTPKIPVPRSESSSEEKLRSPKSPLDMPMTPEQIADLASKISPCVTKSRGKDNARREMKMKLEEGLLDEDTSDIDNIDHFRRQLASEIKRMTEMCDTWDRIYEQTVLPDSIQECVLSAVGQSRLLMSQKLQQFASLVERSARPEPGAALVTPADLHGFWDMVYMQIENVDVRFKKLEELRARNWVEEQMAVGVVAKKKPARVVKAKPTGGPSRLKEMIAAARKAKKDVLVPPASEAPEEKAFEAGFFCVKSPVRSPAMDSPCTPRHKPNLLKAVLSSEAKKSASKNSASFAMLRASVLGRNVDCDGVTLLPQTPIPSTTATPARSILKQASTKKSGKKSIKVVLFNESDDDLNTSVKKQPIAAQDELVDTGVQPIAELVLLSLEDKDEKENSRRKSHKLKRQDAIEDRSPVMTRARRKSTTTQDKTPQVTKTVPDKTPQDTKPRSRKSNVLEHVENVMPEQTPQTPKRSSRRRKDVVNQEVMA